MAAKSKKRLSKIENKLLRLDKLELKDVFCSICHSILIEPVTLPCFHDFCQGCFNGSVENNALCCPLCRLRIGSWLRSATKQKNLVNVELWNFIKSKFSHEIDIKVKGYDNIIIEETPLPRLSEPGEIRLEYEAEIKRLRAERLQIEQKHYKETEILIHKIRKEEEEAHKKYLEALKQDEILALQMQSDHIKTSVPQSTNTNSNLRNGINKRRLKSTKIDVFLTKPHTTVLRNSPELTDDITIDTGTSPQRKICGKLINETSPEMVPIYGKVIKHFIDKKAKNSPGVWNKENGDNVQAQKEPSLINGKKSESEETNVKSKHVTQSLLVSLPLSCTGIFQHKTNVIKTKNMETDSVDSMRQELCYFKPIEGTTPTSFNTNKSLPLRVPGLRAEEEKLSPTQEVPPSRAQYLEGLCHLRNISLEKNLPSAFVIALNMLQVKKEHAIKCANTRSKAKKMASSLCVESMLPLRKNKPKHDVVDGITKLNTQTNLRRTRSMGSINKEDNETTPKKGKYVRKACSERKPYLRSDSKKNNTKKDLYSPSNSPEPYNNNKVNLAVKNLSSPLKNCDVKKILQEQLRIEEIIKQEKSDYELARKMEAEWNGRRQPRRAAIKRQVTLNYTLRHAKKLKV
ncbi:unnamed protein product [Chilo suppressalis]|uniref:RING-type E3 ubiquitin transferase n=1 Tax=Chilo suppressalis TaxID=168631 RepID=A0ABN8B8Q3_CHISP|nr:unnamed protein product [Chilo suppressalis]